MRFKLYYDDKTKGIEINCLTDNSQDVILPENTSQHIYFPIPNNMKQTIKKDLYALIDGDKNDELKQINENIKALTDRRRLIIDELRKEINPKIIEVCEKFKDDHAELFI